MKMKHMWMVMFTVALLVSTVCVVQAEDGWQVEITPYAWLAGMEADISAGSHTAEIDVGFDDLLDQVDLAAAVLFTAQKGQLLLWGQLDYMALSGDGSTPAGVGADVDVDTVFAAGGIGWQFLGGLKEDATTDILVGARLLSLETEVSVDGLGSLESDTEIVDAILILRPSIPFGEKWRFNPTVSVGVGDSDLVWELQPHVQYAFSETVAGRIGYRRLHYEVEGDHAEFDGAFHGFILGLGITL